MATTITLNSSGSNLTSSGGAQKHMHYGFYKNNETTSSNSLYSRGDDDDDDDAFYDAYETNPSWTPPVSPSYLINNERASSIPKQFHFDKLCPIDDQPKLEGASIQSIGSGVGSSDSSSPEYSPTLNSQQQQSQQQQSKNELKSNTLQVNNNNNNNNNSKNNTLKAKRNSRVISLIKNKKEELHNLFHRDGKEKEQQVPSISNTNNNINNTSNNNLNSLTNNNNNNNNNSNQPISVTLNEENNNNSNNNTLPTSNNTNNSTTNNTLNNESSGSLRKLIKKKLTSMNLLDGENSSPPSSLSSSSEISNIVNNNNSNSANSSFTEKQDSRVTRWLKSHNLKKKKELTSKFVLCTSIQAHKGSIWALEVCKEENHIATGGSDGVIRIWKIIKTPQQPTSSSISNTSSSALSDTVSNGSTNSNLSGGGCASEDSNKPKILENIPRILLEGHSGHILELKWINQQLLLSSSIDKTVKLWNIESGECIKTFEHNDIVVSISFDFVNSSLSHFYSATLDGIVRKWSIDNSESPIDSIELGEFITTISLSSNPYYLIVSTHLGNLVFFNPTTLELLHKFNVSQNHHNIKRGKGPKILGMSVVSSSLNSNCEHLLVSSNDSFVRQFSLKDFKRVCKYSGMMLENYQVKPIVSPDKKSIIMGSEDNNIYIYDNFSEQPTSDEIRGSAGNKIIVENYEYFTASNKPITNTAFVTVCNFIYLISTDSLGQILIFNK